jgi:hypothetical protein
MFNIMRGTDHRKRLTEVLNLQRFIESQLLIYIYIYLYFNPSCYFL